MSDNSTLFPLLITIFVGTVGNLFLALGAWYFRNRLVRNWIAIPFLLFGAVWAKIAFSVWGWTNRELVLQIFVLMVFTGLQWQFYRVVCSTLELGRR